MKIIDDIRTISREIINHPKCHIKISDKNTENLSKILKSSNFSEWKEKFSAYSIQDIFSMELIANSVNYCYWYGRGDIRLNKSSDNTMYELLEQSWKESKKYENIIKIFFYKMKTNRFPLLQERFNNLEEIGYKENTICRGSHILFDSFREFYNYSESMNFDMDKCMDFVFGNYNGYGEDIFLKRLQLLMMQIYRKTGKFADKIHKLTVPADYQIPKILRYYGCIQYDDELSYVVDNEIMIPKGSAYETEIRAATILTCDKISELSGTNNVIVDNFLWQSRKLSDKPFHLTITTDY